MSGDPPRTLFVVLADPAPGTEDEFQEWYDTVHGPDALGNGSFVSLSRFRAVGPGRAAAPYLALWEGRFADEAEAWGYIRPRAEELRAAGRAGGAVASVAWALMTFTVAGVGGTGWRRPWDAIGTLTTVQSDWRHPDPADPAPAWFAEAGLGTPPAGAELQWCTTSDPAGRGGGYHLAVFASADAPPAVAAAWAGRGTPGSSPTPPYATIFGVTTGAAETIGPPPARAWVMHWEPVAHQAVAS